MLVPHHLNPLSWEKDIPPSTRVSGIVYQWRVKTNSPRYLSETTPYPPVTRKWEHACGPLLHSNGGRDLYDGSTAHGGAVRALNS